MLQTPTPTPLAKIKKRDFQEFERVRKSGAYNMLDPRAIEMTSLSRDTWVGIMKNYRALMEKFPGVRK